MKKLMMIGVAAVASFTIAFAAGATLPSNVIYSNDFAVSESVGAIPRIGETYTATPYPATSSRLYPYHDTAVNNYVSENCLTLLGYHGWLDFSPVYYAESNGTGTSRAKAFRRICNRTFLAASATTGANTLGTCTTSIGRCGLAPAPWPRFSGLSSPVPALQISSAAWQSTANGLFSTASTAHRWNDFSQSSKSERF